jgi:hypothetical protein
MKSNPPEVAADPDGAGAAVRRHQAVLRDRGAKPVPAGSANSLTPEEMKALGIEGDTPRDTVATLVAQVKQLRNELQTALNDNKNQKSENERMRARESAIDQRIQSALDGERGRLQQDREQLAGDRQQTQGLLQDLQRRLDGLSGKGGQADLPVGLGLEDGDGKGFSGSQGGAAQHQRHALGGTGRCEAFGEERQQRRPELSDQLRAGAEDAFRHGRQRGQHRRGCRQPRRGHVVQAGLHGAVELDADGLDRDDRADRPRADRRHGQRPVPFKVLIGPDNLTANGIDIPDVAGAVVSGTASGDWTLSCVRGQIRSVTFVFNDGTIRTMPEDGNRNQSGGSQGNGATARRKAAWAGSAIPTASPASAASGAATRSSTWVRRRSSPRPAPARPR